MRTESSEIERLRDRVSELEDAMGLTAKLPRRLLSEPMIDRFIGILLARPFGDRDAIYSTLYGGRPESDQPDIKILDIYASRSRKILRRWDIEVKTLYGRGWWIDSSNKTKLRALIKTMEAA